MSGIPQHLKEQFNAATIPSGSETQPAPRTPKEDQRSGKRRPSKSKTAMRFGMLNNFADVTARTLSPTDALIWLMVFRLTTSDGLATTSQAGIAQRAGVSDRTVRRSIDRLEKAGLLDVVHKGSIHRGSSVYRVKGVATEHLQAGHPCPVITGHP